MHRGIDRIDRFRKRSFLVAEDCGHDLIGVRQPSLIGRIGGTGRANPVQPAESLLFNR